MIGRVTMVYPSGSFLVWFEAAEFGVRGYPAQIEGGCVVEVGGLYDVTLSEGDHGRVTHVRAVPTGTSGSEGSSAAQRSIARALAGR